MSEWQPIATAPKDGTAILAWHPDWQDEPLSLRWHGHWHKWILNGVLLDLGDWGEPTHWMPLPPPPSWLRGKESNLAPTPTRA